MARRVVLLIAAFILLTPVLAANSAQAAGAGASFFGTSVSQGDSLSTVDMGNNLKLRNVSVSSVTGGGGASTSTISATGSLYIGSDTSPLSVSVSYSNTTTRSMNVTTTTGDWSIRIARNSAGSGYAPLSGSGVNLNGLSGRLAGSLTNGSVSSGSLDTSLTITGVSYGGATYSGTAAVSSTGIQATVAVDDLTVNGKSVGSLNITASSTTSTTSASVTFGTSGTTVNAALSYTDSKNWSVSLARNGAVGPAAASGAPINFNNVSGTIAKTKGAVSTALSVTGVTVGSATFDATLTASSAGLVASASVDDLTLASGYTIQNASITVSTASNTASISGALVANPTTVDVSASYTDTNDWSISIAANSAGAGYAAPNSTTLDINDISGAINDVSGNISSALTASGVALGDGTFDLVATFNADGTFTASASGQSLTIGGMLLNSAAITLSTATPEADITADFTTDAGTFSFDIGATALSGGGYSLHIAGSAADLAVSSTSSKFAIQSFGFDTTVDVPATGCTSWDAAVNGSLLMRGDTFTLNDAEIAFSCNTLTKFVFSITLSHKTSDVAMKSVTLTISWLTYVSGVPTPYTPTFGTKSQYTSKAPYSGTAIKYYSGFFGTADFSYLYYFQKGSFNKHITFGLGFTVGVYQQMVKTGVAVNPTYSAGAWDVEIGAMGYFDADERINGDIICDLNVAPSNDFVCSGRMYVNPSTAGSYHESMKNI
ncbi:MAG: beta strand repeat-containing protein [Actinomycetota bacterium]